MRRVLLLAAVLGLVGPGATRGATPPVVLDLDGLGPLRLGMTQAEALRTGWLSDRRNGCPLGGPPLPVVYRLAGRKAPDGIRGTVEFARGRLRVLALTRGVRTTAGVTVGRTTVARMVARYRRAGYRATARFDRTFQGTFVTVRRGREHVLSGFATKRVVTTLGVPAIPVCE